MSMATTKPIVYILLGLFLGILLGIVGTVAFRSDDPKESYAEYRARTQGPAPSQSPHGAPPRPQPQAPADAAHGAPDRAEASFAKVHFMKKFVASLTETPGNLMPAADHAPLLAPGAQPIECADCHDPNTLNIEGILASDPGDEAVQPFRQQRRGFMIPLMEKWVGRLNKLHKERLRKEVTCTDCHAIDPRDDETRFAVFPPLMIRFVRALKAPPQNENPAKGWKPLLKDPESTAMLCSVCHGKTGAGMEQNLARFDHPPAAEFQGNRQFKINLMERWVRELNRKMKDQLVKAVVCTDCHEIDPRK
jgi:cytochrome c553